MKKLFLNYIGLLSGVISILTIGASYGFLFVSSGFFFNEGDSKSFPYVEVAISFSAMLLGILFGRLHGQLSGTEGLISIIKEIKDLFRSAEFVKAILIAPIVFCGVYAAAKVQPDRVVAFLFAFQNGFFCDRVFADRRSRELEN